MWKLGKKDAGEFTGTCTCGHTWNNHHHGCIMNPDAMKDREYKDIDGFLGQECEATQFEGRFTPDRVIYSADGIRKIHYDERCDCQAYQDVAWPECTPENRATVNNKEEK